MSLNFGDGFTLKITGGGKFFEITNADGEDAAVEHTLNSLTNKIHTPEDSYVKCNISSQDDINDLLKEYGTDSTANTAETPAATATETPAAEMAAPEIHVSFDGATTPATTAPEAAKSETTASTPKFDQAKLDNFKAAQAEYQKAIDEIEKQTTLKQGYMETYEAAENEYESLIEQRYEEQDKLAQAYEKYDEQRAGLENERKNQNTVLGKIQKTKDSMNGVSDGIKEDIEVATLSALSTFKCDADPGTVEYNRQWREYLGEKVGEVVSDAQVDITGYARNLATLSSDYEKLGTNIAQKYADLTTTAATITSSYNNMQTLSSSISAQANLMATMSDNIAACDTAIDTNIATAKEQQGTMQTTMGDLLDGYLLQNERYLGNNGGKAENADGTISNEERESFLNKFRDENGNFSDTKFTDWWKGNSGQVEKGNNAIGAYLGVEITADNEGQYQEMFKTAIKGPADFTQILQSPTQTGSMMDGFMLANGGDGDGNGMIDIDERNAFLTNKGIMKDGEVLDNGLNKFLEDENNLKTFGDYYGLDINNEQMVADFSNAVNTSITDENYSKTQAAQIMNNAEAYVDSYLINYENYLPTEGVEDRKDDGRISTGERNSFLNKFITDGKFDENKFTSWWKENSGQVEGKENNNALGKFYGETANQNMNKMRTAIQRAIQNMDVSASSVGVDSGKHIFKATDEDKDGTDAVYNLTQKGPSKNMLRQDELMTSIADNDIALTGLDINDDSPLIQAAVAEGFLSETDNTIDREELYSLVDNYDLGLEPDE